MAALEAARKKLEGKFSFEDLPATRDDGLWDRIEREYHLTLPEVSALKNARCPAQQGQDVLTEERLRQHTEMMQESFRGQLQGLMKGIKKDIKRDIVREVRKMAQDKIDEGDENEGDALTERRPSTDPSDKSKDLRVLSKHPTPIPGTTPTASDFGGGSKKNLEIKADKEGKVDTEDAHSIEDERKSGGAVSSRLSSLSVLGENTESEVVEFSYENKSRLSTEPSPGAFEPSTASTKPS